MRLWSILICVLHFQFALGSENSRCDRKADFAKVTSEVFTDLRFSDYAFSENGFQTDAVLVFKGSRLVFEKYRHPYTQDHKHRLWSVTKSFLSAMVGFAESGAVISRTNLLSEFLDEFKVDSKRDLRVQDLLHMAIGLEWREYYLNFFSSSALPMLYGHGSRDMGMFAAQMNRVENSPHSYRYSSGTSNILSKTLKIAVERSRYRSMDVFLEEFFRALGIDDYVFERDGSGTPVGSSYLYLTSRNAAQLGRLFLCDGKWTDARVLPQDWVKSSISINPAYLRGFNAKKTERTTPGSHWFVNQEAVDIGLKRKWPDVTPFAFAALGHEGQHLFVIPTEDLVVVRLGKDVQQRKFDRNHFLKLLLSSGQSVLKKAAP